MRISMTAEQIIQLLDLKLHTTCGYVAESYVSAWRFEKDVLPAGYSGSRSLGDVLIFLVTPVASAVKLHRIRSDQMYHHYLGDPLEVLLLYADGRSEVKIVGPDLLAGQRPQLFIPGGTFHTARVLGKGSYSLLATSVWLRAEPDDVEPGNGQKLLVAYPSAAEAINSFTPAR